MPLANPVTKKSLGQKAVIVLTTPPAAGTGIPTLAEANAGKVLSLHFYGDFAVTPAQNTGEGPRKLGSQFTPTQLGQVNYPAVDAQYSYDPQKVGTASAAGNEALEALTPAPRGPSSSSTVSTARRRPRSPTRWWSTST
jgi:hypothetical protein